MSDAESLGLFDAFGIELEYMIVDAQSLDVLPACDRLLASHAGDVVAEVEFDDLSWSNELTLHVVELKVSRPRPTLRGLASEFASHIRTLNRLAQPLGARLLPTASHPWMDPRSEMRLWPHAYNPVYEAFNRIFDCRGHGWANLQSMHINLPFRGDDEFGRLHAAVRLVLPLLPALAASSPFRDGLATGRLDNRLDAYRAHSARIPSVAGRVIPEPVFHIDAYHESILNRLYRDLEPHDPDGVLRDEFANARGAIARFQRNAIEVRVIDVQECPAMDLAIATLTVETLRALVEERWCSYEDQRRWGVDPLASLFERAIGDAELTPIQTDGLPAAFGAPTARTLGELWRSVAADLTHARPEAFAEHQGALDLLFQRGTLARRILAATGPSPDRAALRRVYARLADALESNTPFTP